MDFGGERAIGRDAFVKDTLVKIAVAVHLPAGCPVAAVARHQELVRLTREPGSGQRVTKQIAARPRGRTN